ncbi:hypothetical protein QX776_03295 [Alteromonadaceae bacterium BrNp21-10]|nr:hypothetical protein [Alteromonadaceae bacterium BrNp21-10]
MKRFNQGNILLLWLIISPITLAAANGNMQFSDKAIATIEINHDSLFPEGISFNPLTNRFVVGSFRQGAIFEVDHQGNTYKVIDDPRLHSVFAVRIDLERNRLLALTSDLGASVNSNNTAIKRYAALAIYDLTSGNPRAFIDLSQLVPDSEHLVNGMTLDAQGNAYITDSFAAAIYKVDISGKASLFLQSDEFIGEGINLNGIVYHPHGYLLAVKKSNGVLYKIPLQQPKEFSAVTADKHFLAADGLILTNNNQLIIIANRILGHPSDSAFWVSSNDDWQSMNTHSQHGFGDVYPTTGIVLDGKIYVVYSKLNTLVAAPPAEKSQLRQKAKIAQIGDLAAAAE